MIIVPRVALKNEVSTMFTRSLILRTMTMSRVELERQGCREALALIGSMSAPKRTPDWCHRSRRLRNFNPDGYVSRLYRRIPASCVWPNFKRTSGFCSVQIPVYSRILMPALLLYSSSGSL